MNLEKTAERLAEKAKQLNDDMRYRLGYSADVADFKAAFLKILTEEAAS